jgi:hypothetical protein
VKALNSTQRGLAVAVLLLVGLGLTMEIHTARRFDGFAHVQWNFRDWQFGSYETHDSVEGVDMDDGTVSGTYTTLINGIHLGPLDVFTATSQSEPEPLGTKTVHVGDHLYDPPTKAETWRVKRKHEFDDDTFHDGVLVRSAIDGGEGWLPRKKIGKVLVGR